MKGQPGDGEAGSAPAGSVPAGSMPAGSVLAARLHAQLLSGPPAGSPLDVADRLLALQAQDLRGVRLAVRSRTAGLRVSDVDRALGEERSLVVTTLNRGTLHLVRSEDLPWLHELVGPVVATANERRLAEEGVPPGDADRAVQAVVRALDGGPALRADLRGQVAAAGVRSEGQALAHILLLASLRGLIVRGPVKGAEQAWVLTRDWLGPRPEPAPRDVALGWLAQRYLAGHAPATDRDLARWTGLPLRDARAGLKAAGARARPDGLLCLPGQLARPDPADLPPPRLLGAFDPVLHGWESRASIVGPHTGIVTSNGIFRPFAMVRGRAVATWRYPAGRVQLEPLEPISPADTELLRRDGEDVTRYLTS